MKKPKFISLRTKLFIVLSALMALILAVQFYLAYQAQQELVSELNRLSNNLNFAIDTHYAGVLQNIQEMEKLNQPIDTPVYGKIPPSLQSGNSPESLYTEVIVELKNFREYSKKFDDLHKKFDTHDFKNLQDEQEVMRQVLEERKLRELEILSKLTMEKIDSVSEVEQAILEKQIAQLNSENDSILFKWQDELAPSIEMIDVNLNEMEGEVKSVIKVLPRVVKDKNQAEETKKVTFRFPDFSLPDKPKLIRYNYQASDIEKAVNASLQRNILLTMALFGLSILIILFISHRFLRPIGVLQSSFKKVVDGDLNVEIAAKSRDEIGDLTISFNHMVDELRKNADKEKLLLRKERLASMGQLAAGVAHEIKNPLNAINLTIEHLGDKLSSRDKTLKKYIQTIQNEIARLDGIVDNFLNFVRSENLNKTETDVSKLISEVLRLLESEIQISKIKVDFNDTKAFKYALDVERFKTVFLNIILNAIHAMPDGGKLHIQAEPKEKLIRISDTGNGIPPENLDKIFDLFYTTKSKGTGLGLPTAFKIVKEHGGEMEIESGVGKGTSVFIKL